MPDPRGDRRRPARRPGRPHPRRAPRWSSATQTLTYAELDARINRMARLLLARGAGPERVVALGLPRSIDMVVALFAVLRTGAAYLPLELDYPADRLVGDARRRPARSAPARPRRRLRAARPRTRPRVLLDDPAVAAELRRAASGRPGPARRFSLEHPAYVIYTSGSTGRPKGVVTPYRGLTNMQLNHRRRSSTRPSPRPAAGGCASRTPSPSPSTCRGRSCSGWSRGTRCTSATRSCAATPRPWSRTARPTASTSST